MTDRPKHNMNAVNVGEFSSDTPVRTQVMAGHVDYDGLNLLKPIHIPVERDGVVP